MMGMGGTGFEVHNEDGDTGFEVDEGFPRDPSIDGYGQSPPVINTVRAVKEGLREEAYRDWKQLSWWRTAVNSDPRIFADFFKAFLEENSIAKFNSNIGPTLTPPVVLDKAKIRDALAAIRAIKAAEPDEVTRVNRVHDEVYNNPDYAGVKEFVQISLDFQYGRRVGSFHQYMNQRRGTNWIGHGGQSDPTYGSSKDYFDNFGDVSIDEAERALSRVEFLDGLSLHTTDKEHSEVIYTDEHGNKQELTTHTVSEVMVGKIKEYSSHFDLGKDAKDNMDKAICALALQVASHSQVARKDRCNEVEVLGLKTVNQTMRLVEELACRHHKHVAMSTAKIGEIDAALADPDKGYSPEQQERWELLKLAMKVYSIKDNNRFFAPDALITKMEAADPTVKFERENGIIKDNPYNRELMSQQLGKLLSDNVYPAPAARARATTGI